MIKFYKVQLDEDTYTEVTVMDFFAYLYFQNRIYDGKATMEGSRQSILEWIEKIIRKEGFTSFVVTEEYLTEHSVELKEMSSVAWVCSQTVPTSRRETYNLDTALFRDGYDYKAVAVVKSLGGVFRGTYARIGNRFPQSSGRQIIEIHNVVDYAVLHLGHDRGVHQFPGLEDVTSGLPNLAKPSDLYPIHYKQPTE